MDPLQLLSNCLGMNITTDAKGLHGNTSIPVKIAKGVTTTLKARIVSGFSTHNQAGVLLHLKGGLYIAVMYSGARSAISCWVVDGDMLGDKNININTILDNVDSIRQAVDKLDKGILKSCYTDTHTHTGMSSWKNLRI
ncbi:MAG: hypothetical protein KAH32_08890 [Chlamydiia bacterium]|nr:hypothetical protein [Chlamydiia bacterium]